MFQMEFQTLDTVQDDDKLSKTYRKDGGLGKSVYKPYRQKAVESKAVSQGRVGKMPRTVSSSTALSPLPAQLLTRSVSSSASVPQTWVEVDLIDFVSPEKAVEEPSIPVDQNVFRDLVKPFADSVTLTRQPRTDSALFVSFLDYKPAGQSRDLLSEGVEYGSNMQTRSSSSMRSSCTSTSWSDSSDAEFDADKDHLKDEVEEKGSPDASRAYNRAFSKLVLKKNKYTMPDAKSAEPWEEPLLASHEQVKLQRKLQKEAKAEAKRLAEKAKRDAEIRKREIAKLANPVPESTMQNHYNMRRGLHKLFQISSGPPREGVVDARGSKLVMPRVGLFESCVSHSVLDIARGHVRSLPRPPPRKNIHFATVESNQRDVEAWTMEQYMAKNGRLSEWNTREDDEEFGGIEGNQLLNQYFDDDLTDNLNSDSD